MRRPEDFRFAPGAEPDFSRELSSYETSTAASGTVTARVYASRDGTLRYTVFTSTEGGRVYAWFAQVTSADSPVNSFGVARTPIDSGDLCTPRWEYWLPGGQQIAEGYNGRNGWAIGEDREPDAPNIQDPADAESLYTTLENEIIPLYYERDVLGVPREWLERVKESIRTVTPQFSTRRMVKEYVDRLYVPALPQRLVKPLTQRGKSK